jgi:hypothetical protein
MADKGKRKHLRVSALATFFFKLLDIFVCHTQQRYEVLSCKDRSVKERQGQEKPIQGFLPGHIFIARVSPFCWKERHQDVISNCSITKQMALRNWLFPIGNHHKYNCN